MQHHRNRGSRAVIIDHLEHRRLLSNTTTELVQEPITIGVPGLKTIAFLATDGRKTTLSVVNATASITFPGPAALTLYQGHAFFPMSSVETISSIVIANALPGKAFFQEKQTYGTGTFDVGSIVGGDLATIVAPDINLTGSLMVSSVNHLTLGSVSAATMSLGTGTSKLQIEGALGGTLIAGNIGALKAGSIAGANITTTDPFSKSKLEIGSIDGGSGILNSSIVSEGNIGPVKAGFLSGSVITAAIDAPAAAPGVYPAFGVPTTSVAIVAPASIQSVKLFSKSITSPAYFLNSVIAADSIGSLQLGQLNGGGGIAAQTFSGLNATGPSGSLDRFPFRLGGDKLHNATSLQKALTHLNIPFTSATGLPEDTAFYGFDVNILT